MVCVNSDIGNFVFNKMALMRGIGESHKNRFQLVRH
jgi:hypothetical protein